jgi:RNA polymerase sigma-70 factor (ECF subfamily)
VEEIEIVSELKQGNQQVFNYVVDLYSTMVYTICLNLVGNREDAEDITQEVFVTLWLSIEFFKGESLLKTWLYRIAINKSHELIRRKSRKKRSGKMIQIDNESTPLKSDQQTPLEKLEFQEFELHFQESLKKLPEKQQLAFMLNRLEGMSYQEIASEMKTSHSSVESLLFRAKKNLASLMKKQIN